MKNFYKILGVIAIAALIGFTLAGCGGGDNGDPNNSGGNNSGGNNPGGGGAESITLNANGEWGWQAIYSGSLFSGKKITQGDTYIFTYSFTSNVSMDYLQVVLIDNSAGGGYAWRALSGYIRVKENIAANTVVSGTVTITATGTATDTTAQANMFVLSAGTGTSSSPTLTFTSLSFGSGNSGGQDPGGNRPTAMDVHSAALKAGQAFTQAAGINITVYSSGCTWDSSSKTLIVSSMYPGNSFNGAFSGTSAQFQFEYEIEITFSSGNTDANITGVRYRIKVTYGNPAFVTYTGLSQAPSGSNPLYESWQSSNINTVKDLTQQKAGATVTIRGTTGQITFPL